MKKYLFASIALGALALASCSNEEFDVKPSGSEGTVTFTASLPASVASRDFSDGQTAKNLQYAVYAQGTQTPLFEGTATFENLKATVSTTLATGKTYDILFWAQADGAPYTFTAATQEVTVNYDGITANNESLDAFFWAEKDLTVTGPVSKTITLTRPFAQVNVGTNDFALAEKAGLTVTQSSLSFSTNVANAINLYSGAVSGEAEVTFGLANIPTTTDGAFPVANYDYLAMAYVLVAADKQTLDVTLATDGTPSKPVFASVPVQRNYRTNIYGALLTNPAVFNVEINPDYEQPDFGQEILPEGAIQLGSQKFTTLAEAVTAATDENNVILLGDGTYSTADLRGLTAKGLTLKCAGASVVLQMSGSITLADKDMVFEGITLETPNADYTGFQHVNTVKYSGCTIKNKLFLYGNEETFDNCKFVNNGDYHVWTYGAKNVTFNNCQFGDYGKSLLVYNETNNLVQTVNINNCKFKGTPVEGKAAVEIDASLLAVGQGFYTININNSTVEGFASGSVSKNNLWNAKKGDQYAVYVDGVKFSAPLQATTNGYNINSADGLKAMAALTDTQYAGKTFTLTADIDLAGAAIPMITLWSPEQKPTIDGAGHTISNIALSADKRAFISSMTGDIKNLTIKGMTGSVKDRMSGLVGNFYGTMTNVHVEDVEITSAEGRVGALVGLHNGGSLVNCSVKNAKLTGTWSVGGLVGGTNEQAKGYENCNVENVTITKAPDGYGGVYDKMFGVMTGNINKEGITFTDCEIINCGDITLPINNTYNSYLWNGTEIQPDIDEETGNPL